MLKNLIILVLFTAISFSVDGQESIVKEFGEFRLEVNPMIGGRITHFQYKGKEILLQAEDHALRYGSTLWPSPQSTWGSSPPENLDIGRYTAEIHQDTILLYSEMDIKTGLQFSKIIYPDVENRAIVIDYSVENYNIDPVQTALWEVTRCLAGSTFFPYGARVAALDSISTLKQFRNAGNVLWYDHVNEDFSTDKQLFFTGSEGWIAHQVENLLFVKMYRDISPQDLPPDQGEVELMVDKNGSFMEIRNNSAYVELDAGDSFTYRVLWTVIPFSSGKIKADNKKIIDKVRKTVSSLQASYFSI